MQSGINLVEGKEVVKYAGRYIKTLELWEKTSVSLASIYYDKLSLI